MSSRPRARPHALGRVGPPTAFPPRRETLEIELPADALPGGAGTVERAVRTRAAVDLGADWVWPFWLERQIDPRSPAFVPPGHLPLSTNLAQRNWTAVGTVASTAKGIVDPRGLLTPWPDGWSLDWWILGEDRWHFPSRDTGVRQSLLEDTPVVETAMRIRGGDAVQRVYAVPGPEPLAVMEIENRTRTPIAVALSIRPCNPEGVSVVERIALHNRIVTVDDQPALLLPRRPLEVAGSTFRDGDVAARVVAETTEPSFPDDLRCSAGLASAAFVFPIAHTAVLRVAVPLEAVRPARRRTPPPAPVSDVSAPDGLPSSAEVVRGWRAQTANRGLRLVVPEGRLASAIEANRRYLLLFHQGGDVVAGPFADDRSSFRDRVALLRALDLYGFHRESAEVFSGFPERQRADGLFVGRREEWDGNGAALHAMAEHWRLSGSLDAIDADAVRRGTRWIERKRRSGRRAADGSHRGLLPAGVPPAHLGPLGRYYWDDFWSLRGLLDGAALSRALGDETAGAAAEGWAAALRADLEASIALVRERLDSDVLPAGPGRGIDAAIIGTLAACAPLRLFGAHEPVIAATADAVRARFCIGPAVHRSIGPAGLGTHLTMQLATIELEAGDARCLERLAWMVDAASTTHTWPEALHPTLGGGCAGDGHDGGAAAAFLAFVRDLLVRESAPDELALCSSVPEPWAGHPLEVHHAPTHHGELSFAVRYHGARPALLWDLSRRHDRPVRLTAPGLDPSWSSTEPRGEALLAAPIDATRGPEPTAEGSFN